MTYIIPIIFIIFVMVVLVILYNNSRNTGIKRPSNVNGNSKKITLNSSAIGLSQQIPKTNTKPSQPIATQTNTSSPQISFLNQQRPTETNTLSLPKIPFLNHQRPPENNREFSLLFRLVELIRNYKLENSEKERKYIPVYNTFLEKLIKKGEEIIQNHQSESHHIIDDFLRQQQLKNFSDFLLEDLKIHIKQWNEDDILYDINRLNRDSKTNSILNEFLNLFPLKDNESKILEKIENLMKTYQSLSTQNKQQILNEIKANLDELSSISFILHSKIADLFKNNFMRCVDELNTQEINLSNNITTLLKKLQTELNHHKDIIENEVSKAVSAEIKAKLKTLSSVSSTSNEIASLLETINNSIADIHGIKAQVVQNPINFDDIKDIIETELGNFITNFNNLSKTILLQDDKPIKVPDLTNIEVFWDKTSMKEQLKTILDNILSKADIQLQAIIQNINTRLNSQSLQQKFDLQTEVTNMLGSVAELGDVNKPEIINQLQTPNRVNRSPPQDNTEIIKILQEIQKMFNETVTPENTFDTLSKLNIPSPTHEIFVTKDAEKAKLVNVLQQLSKQFIEYKEKQTKKSIPDNLLIIPENTGVVEYEVSQFANFQKLSDVLNEIVSISSSNPIDDNGETLKKINELQNLLKTQIIETKEQQKNLDQRMAISTQRDALIAKTEKEIKKAFESILERRKEQQSQMVNQLDLIKKNQENTLDSKKLDEFESLKSNIAELENINFDLQSKEIEVERMNAEFLVKQSDFMKSQFNKEHDKIIEQLKNDNKNLLQQLIKLQTASNVGKFQAVQTEINKRKGELDNYSRQLGEKNKQIYELESKLRNSETTSFQMLNDLYSSEYYKNWTGMKELMEKELTNFTAEKEAIEKKELELKRQQAELDEFYRITVNEKIQIDQYSRDAKNAIDKEITAWEETKGLLNKELTEYKEKYNQLEQELKTTQFVRNSYGQEKQTLEQKNKELLVKLENFEKESLKQIEETKNKLVVELEQSKKLNQTLQKTLESKTNQINSKQAQIDAQSQSIISLNSDIVNLKNKLNNITSSSEQEIETIKLELSSKTSELEKEQGKQYALQQELHQLTDQKSKAQEEANKLKNENQTLNTQIKELSTLTEQYKENAAKSKQNANTTQKTLDEKLQELTQLKENFSKIEKELIQTKEGQISYLTDEQKELIKASQKLQEYTESLEIKVSKKLNELVSKIKEGLNKTKLLLNIDIPSNVNTIHQFIDKIYTYNVQLQINTNNTQFAEQFKSYKKPGNYPLTIEINLGTSSNKMCSNDVLIMQSYLYKHLTPEIKCKLKYDEDNTEQNNTLEENYSICIYIKNNIYTGEKFVMKKLDKYGKFVDFTESENYDEKYFFSNFKNAYKLLIKEGFNPVSGGAVSKQKRLLPNKTFEYNKTTTNKYFEYIQNLVMPIYMMKFIKFYFYKHNKNDKTSQIKDYILNLIVIIGLNVIKQIDLSNALTIDFILTHISYNINKKEESFLIPYFLLYLINI